MHLSRSIQLLSDEWVDGLVAHHYLAIWVICRGGQAVKRIVERTFSLSSGDGLAFYEFMGIPDHTAFKENYRTLLDAMPLDDSSIEKIVAEANRAFDLSRAVFDSIGEIEEIISYQV